MKKYLTGFLIGLVSSAMIYAGVVTTTTVTTTTGRFEKHLSLVAGDSVSCSWPGDSASFTVPVGKTVEATIQIFAEVK